MKHGITIHNLSLLLNQFDLCSLHFEMDDEVCVLKPETRQCNSNGLPIKKE